MEPKFQSSFIPKGPAATTVAQSTSAKKKKSLMSVIGMAVFSIAVFLSIGVFVFNFYLKYTIGRMGQEIEQARKEIQPDVIDKITKLETRLTTTERLLNNHIVVTPIFEFLEEATVKAVRFTEFTFDSEEDGLALSIKGEARGYSAIGLQAQNFNDNQSFKNPIFSGLRLDNEGNVNFEFDALVEPSSLSYTKIITEGPELVEPPVTTVSTTTVEVENNATTTPTTLDEQATSTPAI